MLRIEGLELTERTLGRTAADDVKDAINDRTIGESAQGLVNYLRELLGDRPLACAIAYDTRHRSRDFAELCGGGLDARVIDGLDALVRDQIMPMKTTFTPGHYRRRVAGVLARRLMQRLFEA